MIQPVILAAGRGTRMRSEKPKCLHEVAGKPLVRHILDTFQKVAGALAPIVVVGYEAQQVMDALGAECRYVRMKEIKGTADALHQALHHIQDNPTVVAVNGDHPFLRRETVRRLSEAQRTPPAPLVMGITAVPNFFGWHSTFAHYGRILRAPDGSPERVVEYQNATEPEKKILEVNPNVFCADAQWLRIATSRIKRNQVTGEYHITDLVEEAKLDGKPIKTVSLFPEECYGINTPEELAQAELLAQSGVI